MSDLTEDSCKAGVDSKAASCTAVCTENITETDASNSRSLDPAEEFNMNHKRRGLALIFNQEHFDWELGFKDRTGSSIDRNNLEKRLKELNFEVRIYDDKTKEEVSKRIREASKEDHSDADCFLMVFMSHGEDDHVYARDDMISIKEITDPFKGKECKSLVGKPKIFILQACRGDEHDDPVNPCAFESDSVANEVVVDASTVHTLPAGADVIMCYSVAEGYFSCRDTNNGSWYIQDLCELLRQYGQTLEFTDLLTLVNRKVSMRSIERCRNTAAIGKKQVPCFASMLTKQLYFRPKK